MYKVFISYRREGGGDLAGRIYDRLERVGIKTFFDVEEMRAGKFNEQLYQFIDECEIVVLVLPPNGLDRCAYKDDWVRLEVERAIEKKKIIIPIMMKDFKFPDTLPESLTVLKHYEGIEAYQTYFDAMMQRLIKLMKMKSSINDNGLSTRLSSGLGSVDLRKLLTFSQAGKESSVFKVRKSPDGGEITLNVNFEPTRIRPEIPDFAGAYFLFQPAEDITSSTEISLEMCSPDSLVETVWIELKPKGRAWMHESFDFQLSTEYDTYTIYTYEFSNPKTLECLEEITIVFKPESFIDENSLKGTFAIRNIIIK